MESVKPSSEKLKHEISCRLREVRKALNMTPPAFATAIGAATQTIRDYENEKSIPGGEALAGMARIGVDILYLLTGEKGQTQVAMAELKKVKEPEATYGAASPVDSVLLQQVIDFFHAWLDENKDSVRIDKGRHGATIAVLYRMASQSGKVEKLELEQVLRLVA